MADEGEFTKAKTIIGELATVLIILKNRCIHAGYFRAAERCQAMMNCCCICEEIWKKQMEIEEAYGLIHYDVD